MKWVVLCILLLTLTKAGYSKSLSFNLRDDAERLSTLERGFDHSNKDDNTEIEADSKGLNDNEIADLVDFLRARQQIRHEEKQPNALQAADEDFHKKSTDSAKTKSYDAKSKLDAAKSKQDVDKFETNDDDGELDTENFRNLMKQMFDQFSYEREHNQEDHDDDDNDSDDPHTDDHDDDDRVDDGVGENVEVREKNDDKKLNDINNQPSKQNRKKMLSDSKKQRDEGDLFKILHNFLDKLSEGTK